MGASSILQMAKTLRTSNFTKRNHKDYEILKSFHGLNDILIATLIAYYWDIERFKDVDSFIGYMVMGANPEVSGTSLNRM